MSKIDLDSFVADAMADMLSKKSEPEVYVPVAAAEEVVEAPAPTVLADGFAAMFGAVPKNIADFQVSQWTDIPECVKWHIPAIDTEYVVQVEEAARLVSGLMDGDKILMTGPTGSGKSSLVKYVCAKLGAPFIRINMSADIESGALFGQ